MRDLSGVEISSVQGGGSAPDFSDVQSKVTSTEQIVQKPNFHDFLPGMAFPVRKPGQK